MHFLQKKLSSPSFLFLAVLLLALTAAGGVRSVLTSASLGSTRTVVLDAGHGGDDPGKVSASGVEEKTVNLAIALKCKAILEQNDIHVVMTRTEDRSIEDAGAESKKANDLKNRKAIITGSQADCAVSIHQNSYPDAAQHGAQVFYPSSSEEGKALAGQIQEQLRDLTGEENTREIKANADYYLLRDNSVPTVIAEICFLSNPSEAEMITDEAMQERAAFGVAMGIIKYLNQ